MKRPVTSLCRRPGKKTACGAVCPRCGNNLRQQGRSAAGRQICRAKAARTRAQKQPPARARNCVQATPMWEWRTSCAGWCLEGAALSARRDRGHAQAQKQPPAEAGSCAQAAPMGERQAMGVSGAGKHHTGHPPGQRACPGAKTASGGAGGCLDAGYGCYLPRAIRVIWMHRVGSTARPRIMPS